MQIIHTIPNSEDLLNVFLESRIQKIRIFLKKIVIKILYAQEKRHGLLLLLFFFHVCPFFFTSLVWFY
jgi:hypothetical protein